MLGDEMDELSIEPEDGAVVDRPVFDRDASQNRAERTAVRDREYRPGGMQRSDSVECGDCSSPTPSSPIRPYGHPMHERRVGSISRRPAAISSRRSVRVHGRPESLTTTRCTTFA